MSWLPDAESPCCHSPPVVAVRFGHLYKDGTDRRGIEGFVWQSIVTQLPGQLIAMDPQRLGTPTAAYDLHFQEQFLFFFFFFLGYRGDVHPLPAKHRQRHRTNFGAVSAAKA